MEPLGPVYRETVVQGFLDSTLVELRAALREFYPQGNRLGVLDLLYDLRTTLLGRPKGNAFPTGRFDDRPVPNRSD